MSQPETVRSFRLPPPAEPARVESLVLPEVIHDPILRKHVRQAETPTPRPPAPKLSSAPQREPYGLD